MRTHILASLLGLALTLIAIIDPHDPIGTKNAADARRRGERPTILMLLAVMLLLRVAYIFRAPIDSDEPQHLHVVWGWTHGLLQYRDLFDNHAPLFHLLCTPLLAALGERPTVLFPMRLALFPPYTLTLWSTYTLGRVLFSFRVGLWATLLTGLFPDFLLLSVEFRPDALWTALWLLALTVLVVGPLTRARSFTVGVLLGAALGVSLKTILLLTALGTAVLAVTILAVLRGDQLSFSYLAGCVATALVGLSLVPLALILFFAAQGARALFFYATVEHNVLPRLSLWHAHPAAQMLLLPALLPVVWWGARTIERRALSAGMKARRVVVFLAASVYIWALLGLWPILTWDTLEWEHYLPFYPLAILFLTPALLALPHWITTRAESLRPVPRFFEVLVPTLVATLEIGMLLWVWPLWRDGTHDQIDLLADVLRLTQPSDPVMDLKGETVFRPRPFYYVLEGITNERIQWGLLADDIPERLIATRTCVAVADNKRFPPRGRAFLAENYLPVGRLRVAGRLLTPSNSDDGGHTLPFDVQIPARYMIVAESGMATTGWLDGDLYEGTRFLAPGRHEFRPSSSAQGRLALVWAPAVERGFSPFSHRHEDAKAIAPSYKQ